MQRPAARKMPVRASAVAAEQAAAARAAARAAERDLVKQQRAAERAVAREAAKREKADMKPYVALANKVARGIVGRPAGPWKATKIPRRMTVPRVHAAKVKAARKQFSKSIGKSYGSKAGMSEFDRQHRALTKRLVTKGGMPLQSAAVVAGQLLSRRGMAGMPSATAFESGRLDGRRARLQRLMAEYATLPAFTSDARNVEKLAEADQAKVSMLIEIVVGANNLPDGDPVKNAVFAFLARTSMPPGVTDMVFSVVIE